VDNFDTVLETLYIVAMRIHSRRLLVGTLVLVPFLMVGCAAASDPQLTDSPVQTAPAPVFASNEEALAAATQAYGAYLAMSDQITGEGGARGERIAPFVTASYLPELLDGFDSFASQNRFSKGASGFDTISLARYADDSRGSASILLYLCADITAIHVYDASGVDQTNSDRPNRIPEQLEFVSDGANSRNLLLKAEDTWGGKNFC